MTGGQIKVLAQVGVTGFNCGHAPQRWHGAGEIRRAAGGTAALTLVTEDNPQRRKAIKQSALDQAEFEAASP